MPPPDTNTLSTVRPHKALPADLGQLQTHGLNVLSYLDLPPRDVTLRDEAKSIVDAVRLRACSPEDAIQAIVNLVGREQSVICEAVKRALGRGTVFVSGTSEPHAGGEGE